ncbi:MAG: LacI family DNA-binding transcriptional regulator [Verrucomicrobiota bacterium]|nr:LacI family DNA-binding transcriptional regulator [Verrucomicrobiota bacterium]
MARRTTMEDVAAVAGVSKATVSMVLHNDPRITPATAAKVRAALAELNYVPEPTLSRIAAHRWDVTKAHSVSTLAYLSARNKAGAPSERFRGAQSQAAKLGYAIEEHLQVDYPNPLTLQRVLNARGVAGIVVGRIYEQAPAFVKAFDWSHFPVVACGMGYMEPPFHTIIPNFHQAITTSMNQMREQGCARIGLILPLFKDHDFQLSVHDGYKFSAYYYETSLYPESERIPPLLLRYEDYGNSVSDWCIKHRPQGVILPVSHPFSTILRSLPPEVQPRIVHSVAASSAHPETPGWELPHFQMGAMAVRTLHTMIITHELGVPAKKTIFMVSMDWRESTR